MFTGVSRVRVPRLAWSVVGYTVAVILWGSVVRATGSGAGCGGHWPTCDGEVLLMPRSSAMWFELAHRSSSGLLILLVAGLLIAVLRALPAGHAARKSATAAATVLVVEALLGAGLVLFGLVADNDSAARAVVVAVHLTNTLILLALLTMTAWFASRPAVQVEGAGILGVGLAFGVLIVAIVSATGAVTALGDTLFPAASLRDGIRQDLSPSAHLLVKMRTFHPVLAVAVGGYIVMLAGAIGRARPRAARSAAYVTVGVIGQIAVGFVNFVLMAPILMQVIHLLAADLLWIALIVMSVDTWYRPAGSVGVPADTHGLPAPGAQCASLSAAGRTQPAASAVRKR